MSAIPSTSRRLPWKPLPEAYCGRSEVTLEWFMNSPLAKSLSVKNRDNPHPHYDLDEPIEIIEVKQADPSAAFAAQKRAELDALNWR